MCGRYMFEPQASPEMQKIYELACQGGTPPKTGEVFPTDLTAVVINQQEKVSVTTMAWGFPGFKNGQSIINARAETLEQKPMFARPFQLQRAVYPTTGFFEWNKQKEKYWFNYSQQTQPLYLAGFYDYFEHRPQGIIITTTPNESVATVHNRMPLLLRKNQISSWLKNLNFARQLLQQTAPALTAVLSSSKN
ncbi:MAG: SOS response-associated peptidase family protein [Lactobacillus sp.]|uniref:SOS response-associated peptidase n=1 Tax=Bombilactobacillus bombi TaxID=1303590 RepID=UPI0035E71CBA|nr:SOS response-associated peptidase family protein [Lactobacillus sp.]